MTKESRQVEVPLRVFLSHTSEMGDFPETRSFVDAALDGVRQAGGLAVDMRDFSAASVPSEELDEAKLSTCNVYVGLLGLKYGSPSAQRPDASYTELEYEAAKSGGIDRLIFLLHEDAVLPARAVRDPEYGHRQERFRQRVLSDGVVCTFFRTPDELQRLVKEALGSLVETGGARSGATDGPPLSIQRHEYLLGLERAFRWIDLGGLAPKIGSEILRIPLDEVFVPLQAVRDVPLFDEQLQQEYLVVRQLRSRGASRPEIDRALDQVLKRVYESRAEAEDSAGAEQVDLSEALQDSRVVILGDPGAGKTTFLRYVCYALASKRGLLPELEAEDLLPVYVRLGQYQDHCEKHGRMSLLDYVVVAAANQENDLDPRLLEQEAEEGRCFFLLDGLDEVLKTGKRRDVRDRIEELGRKYSGCKILVTSRIVGYRDVQLHDEGESFLHYTLSAFELPQIESFAEHWYRAITTMGSVTDPGVQNAAMLVRGIMSNASVRNLASNPLLMTLIALMYWRECRLPTRRVELYRSAAEMLIFRWVQVRTPDVELSERQTTSLFMAAAFHMHSTSGSGLITKPELERVLLEQICDPRRTGFGEFEARRWLEAFLLTISEQVGLLYPRGFNDQDQELFGFLHLTFEEYFAGRELARRWEQGSLDLADYLHSPRWEEPLRLGCAHISSSDNEERANAFVSQILNAQRSFESLLHRDLFLAAKFLADEVFVYSDLVDFVFSELQIVYNKGVQPLQYRVRQTLQSMAGTVHGPQALRTLLGLGLRGFAARQALDAFESQAFPEAELLPTVEALLGYAERADRAWQKEEAGPFEALLQRLGSGLRGAEQFERVHALVGHPNGRVQSAAVLVLEAMATRGLEPRFVQALVADLGAESERRLAAIRILESLPEPHPTVIEALIEEAPDKSWRVIVALLGVVRRLPSDARKSVLPLVAGRIVELVDHVDPRVRSAALQFLVPNGLGHLVSIDSAVGLGREVDPRLQIRLMVSMLASPANVDDPCRERLMGQLIERLLVWDGRSLLGMEEIRCIQRELASCLGAVLEEPDQSRRVLGLAVATVLCELWNLNVIQSSLSEFWELVDERVRLDAAARFFEVVGLNARRAAGRASTKASASRARTLRKLGMQAPRLRVSPALGSSLWDVQEEQAEDSAEPETIAGWYTLGAELPVPVLFHLARQAARSKGPPLEWLGRWLLHSQSATVRASVVIGSLRDPESRRGMTEILSPAYLPPDLVEVLADFACDQGQGPAARAASLKILACAEGQLISLGRDAKVVDCLWEEEKDIRLAAFERWHGLLDERSRAASEALSRLLETDSPFLSQLPEKLRELLDPNLSGIDYVSLLLHEVPEVARVGRVLIERAMGWDETIPMFRALLLGQDLPVRQAVARSLLTSGQLSLRWRGELRSLLEHFEGDLWWRGFLVHLAGRLGEGAMEDAVPLVEEYLKQVFSSEEGHGESPGWQPLAVALWSLWRVARGAVDASTRDIVLACTRHSESRIRALAFQALARLASPPECDRLQASMIEGLLRGGEERRRALDLLHVLPRDAENMKPWLDLLVRAVSDGGDQTLIQATLFVMDALPAADQVRGWEALVRSRRGRLQDWDPWHWIGKNLTARAKDGRPGGERSFPLMEALKVLLGDPDVLVRYEAIKATSCLSSELYSKGLLERLLACTSSGEESLQVKALQLVRAGWALIEGESSARSVARLLDDPSSSVRLEALQTLGQSAPALIPPWAVLRALELMGDEPAGTRGLAAHLLGRTFSRFPFARIARALVGALKDERVSVRLRVLDALAEGHVFLAYPAGIAAFLRSLPLDVPGRIDEIIRDLGASAARSDLEHEMVAVVEDPAVAKATREAVFELLYGLVLDQEATYSA